MEVPTSFKCTIKLTLSKSNSSLNCRESWCGGITVVVVTKHNALIFACKIFCVEEGVVSVSTVVLPLPKRKVMLPDLKGRFSGLLQRNQLIQQQNAVLLRTKGDHHDHQGKHGTGASCSSHIPYLWKKTQPLRVLAAVPRFIYLVPSRCNVTICIGRNVWRVGS